MAYLDLEIQEVLILLQAERQRQVELLTSVPGVRLGTVRTLLPHLALVIVGEYTP